MKAFVYLIFITIFFTINLNATNKISGTVFEDISANLLFDGDYNISDTNGDQRALSGVKIYLYKDKNSNGALDSGDEINLTTTTSLNGSYSFDINSNGSYFVVVDSKTIKPASGYVDSSQIDQIWAEQTYAPKGGICTDGMGISVKKSSAGSCFGGRDPSTSDNASSAFLAQHIAHVVINNLDIDNLNFGFSFNVLTHTSDKDDDLNANRVSQGSFRQFILNANAILGTNSMRFVPSIATNAPNKGKWWRIVISDSLGLLPAIGDVIIDATAYSFYNPTIKRDENSGFIGMGGYVGVDKIPLDKIALPELSIDFSNINQSYFCGIRVWEKSVLKNFAIYGVTGTQLNSGASICIADDTTISSLLVGTMANGDNPSTYGLRENERHGIKVNDGVTTISNSYFAYNGYAIVFECPNNTSGCNAGSIVYNNEFYKNGSNSDITGIKSDDGDSIALWHVSGISIVENLIRDTVANGVVRTDEGKGIEIWWDDTFDNEILNNTIIRSTTAGIGFHDGAYNNIAMKNIITQTLGDGSLNSGAGVLIGTTNGNIPLNNKILQNSIYQNSGASIDIDPNRWGIGDGVSANDGIMSSLTPNYGIDYPIFTTIDINNSNNTLYVAGYVGSIANNPTFANTIIEIYKADNDGNTNGEIIKGDFKNVPHGEGRYYIGSCQSDAFSNFDCFFNNVSLNPNDSITATATSSLGSTSEFSAIGVKKADISLLNATDESLVFNWNKPINTKVVNQEFNLTIHAKDKVTNSPKGGVKITKLNLYRCDNTIAKASWWSGSKVTNSNGIVTVTNLIYDKAEPCLFVNIEGNITSSKFDSNSTDKFAIRPKGYIIKPSLPIKAGDKFDINITAVDFNDNIILNYNANKTTYKIEYKDKNPSCSTGVLDFIKSDFNLGELNLNSVTYDNVGELNITISDNLGNEFAKIDSPYSDRFIIPNSQEFTFLLGDFNLSWEFKNAGDGITYYSSDTTNMGSTLTLDIKAINTNGNLATNFKDGCYAKETNATVFFDINTSSALNMKIIGSTSVDKSILSSNIDQNFTYTINKARFTSANIVENIKINFKRSQTIPLEPTFLKLSDINLSEGNIFKYISQDKNATFYYARAHAPDYITVGDNFNATIFYEIYCQNCNKDLFVLAKGDESKDSINWYILPSSIYNSLNSNFHNVRPLSIVQPSISNDTIPLKAPKLPFQVEIKYDPLSWLVFNKFSQTNPTHKFIVKFNSQKANWIGKGDIGKSIDTNISTQTNHKLNW